MIRRVAAILLLAACAMPARAQDPPATSTTADEPIEPDRPDVTNGTHIVDPGLLQVEVGGLFTQVAAAQQAFGSPMMVRLGMNDWLELRMGGDGVVWQRVAGVTATGMGNVQLGAKIRLWADPGGVPVLSILPTVNVPAASAEKGLGTGSPDYTLVLLTGTDFATRGHVDVNYGIGAIGAPAGQPHYVQQLVSVSASMAATDRWNPYAELFWVSRQDPAGTPVIGVDAGAIYTFSARLALDGGAQVGFSRAAPAFAAFGGVSVVVGNVMGEHGVHARQRKAHLRAVARHK